jgi:hypothetical protein
MPILLASGLVLAEEPMSVEDALNYQLPENTCTPPEFIEDGTSSAAPVQDPGGVPYFQGSSTANISDTDYYERERQGRKENRWNNCLADYKDGLLQDMERLKSSAQHGLTEQQAHAIVAHMRLIQDTYLSPDGEPPAPAEVAEN